MAEMMCPPYEAPRFYVAESPTSVQDRAWLAVRGFLDRRLTWAEALALVDQLQAHSEEEQGVRLAALCYLKSFKTG
jgi:hypothetical protein